MQFFLIKFFSYLWQINGSLHVIVLKESLSLLNILIILPLLKLKFLGSVGNWNSIYLCNQGLSPLLFVKLTLPHCKFYSIQACEIKFISDYKDWWFSKDSWVSSTSHTDRYDWTWNICWKWHLLPIILYYRLVISYVRPAWR
jgi:hypothetical protein